MSMEGLLETDSNSEIEDAPEALESEAAAAETGDESEPRTDGRPEYCPEKFWDHENGIVRTEAMLKSYSEIEKAFKEKSSAPTVPEEYELAIPAYDDIKDDLGDVTSDAYETATALLREDCSFSNAMQSRAKQAGLSQDQFAAFAQGYAIEQAKDFKRSLAETRETLLKEADGNEKAVMERLAGLSQAVRNAYRDDPKKRAVLNWITHDPTGVHVLEDIVSGQLNARLRANGSGKAIPVEAGKPQRLSESDIRQMMSTDAYQQGDPATHKKVAEAWQSLEAVGALK